MTYNIRHGLGNATDSRRGFGSVDLERTAEVIRLQNPDIVAIQEVDRFWSRSGNIDQPAELAHLLDMEYAFAPNLIGPAEVAGQNECQYGVMILSNLPLLSSHHTLFPGVAGWEQRGFVEAQIEIDGIGPISAICTHLEVGRESDLEESRRQRTEQASLIAQLVASSTHPAIVMGDFNAQPDRSELSCLLSFESGLVDAWATANPRAPGFTIPAMPGVAPDRRIDFILATRDFQVISTEVVIDDLTHSTSDHFPVVATLEI